MAGGGGGGKSGDNRKLMEALCFLLLLGFAGLEMHLVFHRWWNVFDKWFQRNPVTPFLLILGLIMCPVTIFMWIKSSGKRLGEEAEEIARGARR